jgi:Tol biopolymer transport system component
MSLSTGARLGPYEILAAIGAGGMGEVYKACDTRLNRSVAIKISGTQFSERFEREARAIAALNHPHICALYDVGPDYLVMELVEGPTLATRIAAGPVSLDEALAIARQIAEALEAAHERGIIHRDLKPSNIKLAARQDSEDFGNVKVLDFGLAKAMEASTAADLNSSPTLTLSPTREGVILGTAAYMSPEQARGAAVDKRADVWAFGVVFYEMLTGRRTFAEDTVSDTLAAVLKTDPDWNALPPDTPESIRRLLRRCLQRDRKRRLRDIGDALIEIDDAHAEPDTQTAPAATKPLSWQWSRSLAAVLAVALAATLWFFYRATRPTPSALMRLTVDLGAEVVDTPWGSGVAISPDGSQLAFVSHSSEGATRLFLRAFESAKATPLPGTENAQVPFFSPDGRWVAFFADGKLKKIATTGNAAATLCDAPSTRGGSWGEDGYIVFAPFNRSPLFRVSSAGGTPQPVTELKGEWTDRFPQVLPGAEALLFTSCRSLDLENCTIEVQSLSTRQRKALVQDAYYGRYVAGGHVIYMHQGNAFAARMSLKRLELVSPASPVLEDVSSNLGTGVAQFDSSRFGTLVYIPGKPIPATRSIFWLDAAGRLTQLAIAPRTYHTIRISRDGTRLALVIPEGSQDNVWIYELTTDRLYRLTFLNGNSQDPVWAPDGKHLVFSNDAQSPGPAIYWIRADGAGEAQRLLEGSNLRPRSFWRDGKRLLYGSDVGSGPSIWTLPLEESESDRPKVGRPQPILGSAMGEHDASVSPDGRWIAYISVESGTPQVYVRSLLAPGGRWMLSSGETKGAGFSVFWSSNGRELFYTVEGGEIMVVSYTGKGETFSASQPRLWSPRRTWGPMGYPVPNIDLASDGKRFAVILPTGQDVESKPQTHVVLLLNFLDELQRHAPPGSN